MNIQIAKKEATKPLSVRVRKSVAADCKAIALALGVEQATVLRGIIEAGVAQLKAQQNNVKEQTALLVE
jgi:hypothetical protein